MKKNLLMGFGAIIVALIIVVAIIICIKINTTQEPDKDQIIVYDEQEQENNNEIEKTYQKIELITSDKIKKEYNHQMQNTKYGMRLNMMLYSKIKSWQSTNVIGEFNSGKFNDQEKYNMLAFNLDVTDEVSVYEEPAYWISIDKIQTASKSLFDESIDITKLDEITIKDGKIKKYFPTGFGIELFRSKSLILDEATNIYTLTFDWLKYDQSNEDIFDSSVIEYDASNIIGTFELKYKLNASNKILLELNKI